MAKKQEEAKKPDKKTTDKPKKTAARKPQKADSKKPKKAEPTKQEVSDASTSEQEEPAKKKTTAQRNEKGQFVKGCAKTGGRQPGTKNKYGNVRDRLKEIIMPYLEPDPDNMQPGTKSLATDLMAIDDPNDRVHAVAAILPYIVPKFTSTTITADSNRPISEEEHLLEMDAKYTKTQIHIDVTSLTIVDNDNPDGDYDPDDDPDFNIDEIK